MGSYSQKLALESIRIRSQPNPLTRDIIILTQLCNHPSCTPKLIFNCHVNSPCCLTKCIIQLNYVTPSHTRFHCHFLKMYCNKPTHMFNHATDDSSCIAAETFGFLHPWLVNHDCIITHVCTYPHRCLHKLPHAVCYLGPKSLTQ